MDSKPNKPSRKRRAILRGSLAAPVVLTVSSPSAATMTTLGRCLANLENGPQPPYLVDTVQSGDTWLRIQVPVYRLTHAGNENNLVAEFAFYDEGISNYRHVAFPHPEVTYPNGVNQHNLTVTNLNSNRWGLKWVDETGKVESTKIQIEPPSGHRAVTGTCWTSFKNASPA